MKAMLGWSIERELVTAARNSRKKNMNPKTHPSGICAKNSGSTLKPRSNRLSPAPITPDIPKNATAAGTVIIPPRQTSQNSLALHDVTELRTMSSLRFK